VPLDRRVWLEAQALSAHGYEVSVIGPRGEGRMHSLQERIDGVRILRYPQRAASGIAGYLIEYPLSMAFTLAWLLRLRLRGPIDVIHGSNPPDLFFLFGLIGRAWGAKFVFDQHDANPELSTTKWGGRRIGGFLRWLTERLEAASYRTASLVIVPNDAYARIAAERGRVPSARLAIVRNAPPSGRFRQLAAGIRAADTSTLRLGYLGVMGSQDGVDILIQGLAISRDRNPDLHMELDLIGDGEARPALEHLTEDLGLANVVRFHGYLAADLFVPILARAHLCVSPDPPTPFNDLSTMTKVVEYLAVGRPVVAFDLAETRRLIGEAGVVVADASPSGLADALVSLGRSPERLSQLEDAAWTRLDVLGLTWERSAADLIAAYDSLLSETDARS
jgi:glycosyltransferase involved in cell wall biosynthesis